MKDWDIKINYGIKTGYNEAFIIDEETKDMLIKEDKKSAEIIKPLLRGRDIDKYIYHNNGLYLINTHNGVKESNIKPIDVNKYKAIKKHLDKYYSQLEKRGDKGITPYNLRNCAYLEEFDKPKIVWKQTSKYQTFMLDTEGYYITVSAHMLTIKDNDINKLKYILSILNSNLFKYYMLSVATNFSGVGIRWLPAFIENVPIPEASSKNFNKIIKLVDDITELKKQDKDTTPLEKNIDEIVYSLYGLNDEEVKVVEG